MEQIVSTPEDLFSRSQCSISDQVAQSLQWVQLASGNVFRNPQYSKYFHRNERADQVMLTDLKELRRRLKSTGLAEDTAHDLIARLIFIEFLFQRKDTNGRSALNPDVLNKLKEKGVLRHQHSDLSTILQSHGETYSFFRELNRQFNGDLFPGKGATPEEREAEWRTETDNVKDVHLRLLADFVSGKMELSTGQMCLWQRYAFDVIPLEFISSIYEEFVSGQGTGVHYTPPYIVDFILDKVLPWHSKKWRMKICDPACGSGIFLVKAFQRLVYRWRQANRDARLPASTLRHLLENNLFGVDIDPHAVRVASFSLYLAMCDELEPRYIWQTVHFPRLRDSRLISADFFKEDIAGFQTDADSGKYDIVIGNAPWGKDTETPAASAWAKRDPQNIWPIANHNIGPLFLVKAAKLAKRRGRIAMLQPASSVLFTAEPPAVEFRKKLFNTYKVEELINLSVLRFGLFSKAISPACIVVMRPVLPDGTPLTYVCPKPTKSKEDDFRIIIEPYDVHSIEPCEASTDRFVWTALAWGGTRDLALVRRLAEQPNLEKLVTSGVASGRRGIGRGTRAMQQDQLVGMRLLENATFPAGTFMCLDAEDLPVNTDPFVYAGHSTDMQAFQLPQMILELSWRKGDGLSRFRAAIVQSNAQIGPVLCSKKYASVHMREEQKSLLQAACLSFNSTLAVYYMLLTSGRFAFYRPNPNVEDFLKIPIPDTAQDSLKEVADFGAVDVAVRHALHLNEAEQILIDDLFDYTLPDFKEGVASRGRRPTRVYAPDLPMGEEHVLQDYCNCFQRVLKAAFGEKPLCATIFLENAQLPVRVVGIHLERIGSQSIRLEPISSEALLDRINCLASQALNKPRTAAVSSIFYQRVARLYVTLQVAGKDVPTILIIKPDQVRYWTRSMAMRDADEVALDIFLWRRYPHKGRTCRPHIVTRNPTLEGKTV